LVKNHHRFSAHQERGQHSDLELADSTVPVFNDRLDRQDSDHVAATSKDFQVPFRLFGYLNPSGLIQSCGEGNHFEPRLSQQVIRTLTSRARPREEKLESQEFSRKPRPIRRAGLDWILGSK
jgi:hypothetical protein